MIALASTKTRAVGKAMSIRLMAIMGMHRSVTTTLVVMTHTATLTPTTTGCLDGEWLPSSSGGSSGFAAAVAAASAAIECALGEPLFNSSSRQ